MHTTMDGCMRRFIAKSYSEADHKRLWDIFHDSKNVYRDADIVGRINPMLATFLSYSVDPTTRHEAIEAGKKWMNLWWPTDDDDERVSWYFNPEGYRRIPDLDLARILDSITNTMPFSGHKSMWLVGDNTLYFGKKDGEVVTPSVKSEGSWGKSIGK